LQSTYIFTPTPPLTSLASKIPYGTTAIAIASFVGYLIRSGQLSKTRDSLAAWATGFRQVVQSVEKAFPSKTDTQKQALAAVQDEVTRQLVDSVKGS
jgi:hypothetical protein